MEIRSHLTVGNELKERLPGNNLYLMYLKSLFVQITPTHHYLTEIFYDKDIHFISEVKKQVPGKDKRSAGGTSEKN